jgi:hypothetical protein
MGWMMGGFLGALIGLAALAWVPLHFSGVAILYDRSEPAPDPGSFEYPVFCRYFTSTGTFSVKSGWFGNESRSRYYCPRWRSMN